LSYLANTQTDRQTNKQTNKLKSGKNITSLAEVKIVILGLTEADDWWRVS